MTISELKRYIYENDKIRFVLESLNCHNINYDERGECFSAAFPDGDNPKGIIVSNNEYLNYKSFSRGVSFTDGKDIVDLVQYVTKKDFVGSVKYLHSILGLKFGYKKEEKVEDKKFDPLAIFKKVLMSKHKSDNVEIQTIDEGTLDEFVPMLHISWLRDGIIEKTRKKFGLCYSYKRKRVIIPLRNWLTGELMGINARTTVDNYDELDIRKYYISPSYQKTLNLFGLYENYETIKEAGYVVVYEAERSVLKRDSMNDPTGVALSGHILSEEQVRILIGLNVEIVIALDKDVPIEEVWNACEKFYRLRNVSYIYDEHDVLKEKESPADGNKKVFDFLFKYRIPYDKDKHEKYLESLKK